jgi:hypothetical protein
MCILKIGYIKRLGVGAAGSFHESDMTWKDREYVRWSCFKYSFAVGTTIHVYFMVPVNLDVHVFFVT